jgi:hypothetical protein
MLPSGFVAHWVPPSAVEVPLVRRTHSDLPSVTTLTALASISVM